MDNIKDKILFTARNLFASYGFNGTSMRQISKEADVSLSMINYHYKSKINLLQEIITHLFTGFTKNLEIITNKNINDWDILDEFLEGMYNLNGEEILTISILENEIKILRSEKEVYNNLICIDSKVRTLFSQILDNGYKSKSFKKSFDNDFMNSLLFGIIHELMKEIAGFITDAKKIITYSKELENLRISKLENTKALFRKILS